jgi:peptidoglycan/LPS O-acetylase OafA/YrhL
MNGRTQSTSKIEELESLRGIAAIVIILFHAPKWNPLLDAGIVNNGYLMVELFFVLSGFVIFTAYAEKIESKKDVVRFQFLRFGRLYPIHLVFLTVFVAIEAAKYVASTKLDIKSPNTIPFETNNLSEFFTHLFLLTSALPNQPFTYNYPAWSTSAEIYTYLLFSFCTFFFKGNKNIYFSVFAVVSLLLLATGNTFGFKPLLRCFSGFFIGCLTASFIKSVGLRIPSYVPSLVLVLIILFLHLKTYRDLDVLMFFLSAALIASLVLSETGWLKTVLNSRPLILLGTISYSVYMSQLAVLWITNQIIRVFLKKHEAIGIDGKSTPQLDQFETLVALSVVVLMVLIVSYFTYTFVEKPIREKTRQIVAR